MSLAALPFALPESLLRTLRQAYSEPPRAYHSFAHVEEVLGHYGRVLREGPGWRQPAEVAAAILFHDAIYEAGRRDNEARSAELVRALLPAHLPELDLDLDLDRVAELILLTAQHGKLDRAELDPEAALFLDTALFLDADMAILAAEPERFSEYEAAIREEYRAVPDALYRQGRGRFLSGLLERDRIYLSDFFFALFEARARKNIEGALVELGVPSSETAPR